MRFRRTTLLAISAAATLLIGGTALSGPSWVTTGAPPTEDPGDAPAGPAGPDSRPEERPDGPLASRLSEAVATIPELRNLLETDRLDFAEGGARAGIVGLVASDGSRVDIVIQRLPAPIDVRDVGSPDDTRLVSSPQGVDLILRDLGHTLQVVGVDPTGLAVNVIVERINRQDPGSPTVLDDVDLDRIQRWVIDLLDEASSQGWAT